VLIDSGDAYLEQLRDKRLAQPKRLIDKAALNPCAAVFSLVQNEFAGWGRKLARLESLLLWHPKAL
jgi:hypothetical protein